MDDANAEVWKKIEGKVTVTREGEWVQVDVADQRIRIKGMPAMTNRTTSAKKPEGPVTFGSITYQGENIQETQVKTEKPGGLPPDPESWTAFDPEDKPKNVVATRMKLVSNPVEWVYGHPPQNEIPPGNYVEKASGYNPGPLQNTLKPGQPLPPSP